MSVEIGLQSDKTRTRTKSGIVDQILSKNTNHPHGILVRLTDGSIGRVKKSIEQSSNDQTSIVINNPNDQETILELIKKPESNSLEFKSSFSWCLRTKKRQKFLETVIMKSISSLANSDGGTLLIGVSDNGEIIGLQGDYSLSSKNEAQDGFELKLMDKLIDAFSISVVKKYFQIKFFTFDNEKDVCAVFVKRSMDLLYLKDEKGNSSKVWIRVGNSTRQLPTEDIIDYDMTRKQSIL